MGEQYSKLRLWATIGIEATEAVDTQLARLYDFAQGLEGFKRYSKLDLDLWGQVRQARTRAFNTQRRKNLNMDHIKGMVSPEAMQVLQDAGMG